MAKPSLYKIAHACFFFFFFFLICRVLDTWVGERPFPHAGARKEKPARFTKGPRGAPWLSSGRPSRLRTVEPAGHQRARRMAPQGGRRGDGDESLSQRRKAPPARPLARGRVPLGSGPVRTVNSGHVGQGPRTLDVRATKRGVRQR